MGSESLHPPRLPHYPQFSVQRGNPHRKSLGMSPLCCSPLLPQQNPTSRLLSSLWWRCRGHRSIFWCPRQGVPSPTLFWALCQGILKTQSSFQFKAELELHEPSVAGTMFLCLPCPFHSPVRGCICLSLSHGAPPPALGILMFVSRNVLSSRLHSFYLPKESSQAPTSSCLQSLSKPISLGDCSSKYHS